MLSFFRAASLVGIAVFGGCLVILLARPDIFERSATGFMRQQIEAEIRDQFPMLGDKRLAAGLGALSAKLGERQREILDEINSELPEFVAEIVGMMCVCAPRREEVSREVAESVRKRLDEKFQSLGLARQGLEDIAKGKYEKILAALRRDILIFTATNTVAFALVLLTGFIRDERRYLIMIPSFLLLCATVLSTWLYIFDQNWFYTILFNDYYGDAYAVLLGAIFALLLDIVMNRGRVSLRIAAHIPLPFPPFC